MEDMAKYKGMRREGHIDAFQPSRPPSLGATRRAELLLYTLPAPRACARRSQIERLRAEFARRCAAPPAPNHARSQGRVLTGPACDGCVQPGGAGRCGGRWRCGGDAVGGAQARPAPGAATSLRARISRCQKMPGDRPRGSSRLGHGGVRHASAAPQAASLFFSLPAPPQV